MVDSSCVSDIQPVVVNLVDFDRANNIDTKYCSLEVSVIFYNDDTGDTIIRSNDD